MHCAQSLWCALPSKQRCREPNFRLKHGKSFTPPVQFFRARPERLDAKNTSSGTQKSSRRAGDILGYSGNADALRADATGDSMLFR